MWKSSDASWDPPFSNQRFVSGTGWEVQRRRAQKCGSIEFWARRIKADADISLQRRFLE
jgi:hypothetical protein